MGKDINMDALKTHQFHFDKQMITLYDKFIRVYVPENYFEPNLAGEILIPFQKFTFSFGLYVTYYAFNPNNRFLYCTRPKDLMFENNPEDCSFKIPLVDDPRWLPVIEKIEQYAETKWLD